MRAGAIYRGVELHLSSLFFITFALLNFHLTVMSSTSPMPNVHINTKLSRGIKAFAPASVANVACGFDILGFALEKPGDEIIARLTDAHKGLKITRITGGTLPFVPEKNTAGYAILKYLEHIGESERGIEIEIHKKMPCGSGLGSSAASAVCGVMAVNELLKRPLTKRELLPFATLGESIASGAIHADNVAPSLLGGFTLVRDSKTSDVHRIHAPRGMFATVVYPHVEILTRESRAALNKEVSLKNSIQQSANLGAFIIGMFNSDFDLIRRSLIDIIIEPQRAPAIPSFYALKAAAESFNVLGCSISGSGPSVFALSQNSFIAENVAEAFRKIYSDTNIKHDVYISPINNEGAIVF